MHAVITENDTSVWEDQTGLVYHFPKRYLSILSQGTQVLYYKGSLKHAAFRDKRLTDQAHYFGMATIGRVYPDRISAKGDHFAAIEDYTPFGEPVPNRLGDEYLEPIPESRRSNYWRDGVRKISQATYERILGCWQGAAPASVGISLTNDVEQGLTSGTEGSQSKRYVTVYERSPKLRALAISIHGLDCQGCGFNFERAYGSHGRGFIHVHHVNPVSEMDGPARVNPETDMVVLCPNCHSMVHRRKQHTLSLDSLRALLGHGAQA
jgi:putative restriction endonuclease